MYRDEWNYHREFTPAQKAARSRLYHKYLKMFKVLDYYGHVFDGSIFPNMEWPIPWNPIMSSVYKALLPYKDKIVIEQIKEKLDGLRIYVAVDKDASDKVYAIIRRHERMVEEMYKREGVTE